MRADLKVLHVIADLDPRSGGTSRAVADLTSALSLDSALDVAVMFLARRNQEQLPTNGSVRRIPVAIRSRWDRVTGLSFRRALIAEIKRSRPEVIHLHGMWQPLCHWAASLAASHGIPLVTQPHGMLDPWAMSHKPWRKRLSMFFYQRRDLGVASLLVASTDREMESFRLLGLENDVAVIPHGISGGHHLNPGDSRARDPNRLHTALFLSRLHPVKGLPNLLRAWSEVDRAGWQLVVAGADEDGHLQQVRDLIASLGLSGDVRLVGEVQGEAKADAYRSADIFVLPTQSENFGIVIAEALSYGVPVITTRAAPWGELETYRCGWWIDQGVEPLVNALRAAMMAGGEERRGMGERGRKLARKYQWESVAPEVAVQYRRLAEAQVSR